ncbi:MAG: FkbM family methyltransferase [Gemmataceae bacterium]
MTDTLAGTMARFRDGSLAKHSFIEAMHSLHARLFEYPALLHGGEILGIEIAAGGVVFITKAGIRFRLDPADQRQPPLEVLNFGPFEKEDGEMLAGLIAPGAVVYDVGANIGWYSLHLAAADPSVRVFAFEPVPSTLSRLRDNLALNGLPNITLIDHGLSDRDEELTFYVYPEGSGGSSAANMSGRPSVHEVRCVVKRLDDVYTTLSAGPDVMKVDVEGAELFVLRGAVECLNRHRPVVFCEMLRKWAAKFNYHPNDIIDLLRSLGYTCFIARPGRHLVACPQVTEATAETNFFFLHNDRHAALVAQYARD